MPFWIFKEKDDDRQKRERQQATIKALEAGDIPPLARQRLEEQRDSGHKFFSSTLTTNEYLLAREAGYEPIGQVMGTSFMRVGFGNYRSSMTNSWMTAYSTELTDVTYSYRQARLLAVERLKKEAAILGAHGIIGVHIKVKELDWASNVTEFTAVGTAIKVPGNADLQHLQSGPFTSSLSGQEFWQLFQAGYWPLGLVMGNCTYYTVADWATRNVTATSIFPSSFSNQELLQFTQGFGTARELAVTRLTNEIANLGADGAVDMDINYHIIPVHVEVNNTRYLNMVFDFVALGTAVVKHPDARPRSSTKPLMMIDLTRGGRREIEFDEPIDEMAQGGFADDEAME